MVEVEEQWACFTGHRPEKLHRTEADIRRDLRQETERAIREGIRGFISGMARGVDIWAAQIVLELRDGGQPVRLMCACPYPGFDRRWSREWQRQYREILASADGVTHVCESYRPACFQLRNQWMVDRSARVIAVFNGEKGGTKNTVAYAEKMGVPVFSIPG